jgi:hypothetical protein
MALTKQISSRALILSPSTAEVTTAQTIAPYYDFRVTGVLDLTLQESLDASRYVQAEQTFFTAKVSVRVGGTSEYNITVISYDAFGGNPVTHINITNQQFTTDNSITTLGFVEDEIAAERTLVFSIRESLAGTPVEDFCLTIISTTFADLSSIVPGSGFQSAAVKGPELINTQAFTLLAKRVISITSTGVNYGSADDVPSAQTVIGITAANSPSGSPVNVIAVGLAAGVLTGLGFVTGDEIYLGLNGEMVNSATAGTFPPGYVIKQVGFAVDSSDMWIQIASSEIII